MFRKISTAGLLLIATGLTLFGAAGLIKGLADYIAPVPHIETFDEYQKQNHYYYEQNGHKYPIQPYDIESGQASKDTAGSDEEGITKDAQDAMEKAIDENRDDSVSNTEPATDQDAAMRIQPWPYYPEEPTVDVNQMRIDYNNKKEDLIDEVRAQAVNHMVKGLGMTTVGIIALLLISKYTRPKQVTVTEKV